MTDERVTLRELKQHTDEIFKRVKEGHTIEVAQGGEVLGQIKPPNPADETVAKLVAEGVLDPAALETLPTGSEGLPKKRMKLPAGSKTGSDIIDESREERLLG